MRRVSRGTALCGNDCSKFPHNRYHVILKATCSKAPSVTTGEAAGTRKYFWRVGFLCSSKRNQRQECVYRDTVNCLVSIHQR